VRDTDYRPLRRRERRPRPGDWIIRSRIWFYVAALLVLLAFRFIPGLQPDPRDVDPKPPIEREPAPVVLSGTDLAPNLIPQLVEEYRAQYPWIVPELLPGGTRKALEDLINGRSDLAILNRLPTAEERTIISSRVDSLESYSIAMGGIAVLAGKEGGPDSVTTGVLRAWFGGGRAPGAGLPPADPAASPAPKLYVPDPNLGLWDAFASQLGVAAEPPEGLVWLADERAVAQAVGADPGSIGIASTLSLPADLDELGARLVPVRGDTTSRAVLPYRGQIARGDYPLFHYLYVAMRPGRASAATGFVTFVYSGRGQRLVQHQGFVPARQTARIIQLVSKPLG